MSWSLYVKLHTSLSSLSIVLVTCDFAYVLTTTCSMSWSGFKIQKERSTNDDIRCGTSVSSHTHVTYKNWIVLDTMMVQYTEGLAYDS